jgi:hypothetical protein
MTDEEISACRKQQTETPLLKAQQSQPTKTSAKRTPEQVAIDEATYRANAAAESAHLAARRAADAAPVMPQIGMTAEQAQAVLDANTRRLDAHQSGGEYDWRWYKWHRCSVNLTTTARGRHEQWVCGDTRSRGYLYFDDGVLTSIQDEGP